MTFHASLPGLVVATPEPEESRDRGASSAPSPDVVAQLGFLAEAPPGSTRPTISPQDAAQLLHTGAIAAWNRLREVNLTVPSLRKLDVRNLDLSEIDLRGCDLSGADLRGCELRKARLQGAILVGVRADGANLTGTDLSNARATAARFDGARLVYTVWRGADLTWTSLSHADLRGADFTGAQLLATGFGITGLAGAKVQADQFAPTLRALETTSKQTQGVMVTLLTVSAYAALAAANTKPGDLISNTGSIRLPLIESNVSVQAFLALAPIAILVLFCYFQLLQRQALKLLLRLPWQFPDGETLSDKGYAWMLSAALENRLGSRIRKPTEMLGSVGASAVGRAMGVMGSFAKALVNWGSAPLVTAFLASVACYSHRPVSIWWGLATFWTTLIVALVLHERELKLVESSTQQPRAPWLRSVIAAPGLLLCIAVGSFVGKYAADSRFAVPDMVGAEVPGAQLQRLELRGAAMYGAKMVGANLEHSVLSDAILSQADLSRAYVGNTQLHCAVLAGVNLSGAYAVDADLARADLRAADLRGANLTQADLRGADLREAKLDGTVLDGVRCDVETLWPGGGPPRGITCIEPAVNVNDTCDCERKAVLSEYVLGRLARVKPRCK